MSTARARARRLLDRVGPRDQRGFTLIECIVAMAIFVIVATGLAGMLASGVTAHQLARERTLAKQNALAQIEYIRRWKYEDLGFVSGNPPGTIPVSEASKQISLNSGASGNNTGTMVTQIAYVNDPTPTSYATAANYKRLTVTVTRNLDSKQLIRSVTYVAPSTRAPLGGINNAIANVTVTDFALSTPIENATVNLGAGPSAPRSDVTDATGNVSFPALTPTTGAQPNYTVQVPDFSGYETMPEDKPPAAAGQFSLAPTQTLNTSVRLYKPATINLTLTNPTQGNGAGKTCAGLWLSIMSPRRAQKVSLGCSFGGTSTITSINSEDLIPGLPYTLSLQRDVNPGPSRYYAPSTTLTVPSGYPTNLSQTFTMTLGSPLASRSLTVRVRKSGNPVIGARVDVVGGPDPGYYFTSISNSSGNALFDLPQTTSPCTLSNPDSCYTVTAWNLAGTGTGQALDQTVNSNTTITVNVP